MWKKVAIAALVVAVPGCSATEQRAVAEAEVQRFHRLYNAREPQRLYAAASDELKRITQEQDFVTLMVQLHDQFGNVRAAERTSWNVDLKNGVTTVKLGYATTFERGAGAEEFAYRIDGGRPILVTYKINSDGAEPGGN